MRGLSTEGNLCFKIDRASHIVGRKFTIFALFCFIFGGNFQVSTSPLGGAHIRRDNLTEGCLHYEFGGLYLERLIHGGAYFRNFTVCNPTPPPSPHPRLKGPQVRCIYISPSCLGWSCFKLTAALMTPAFALNPSFVTT